MAIRRPKMRFVVNPFVSEAQRKWMYANHPDMAKRWESHTPKGKLPKHVRNTRKRLAPMDPSRTLTMRKALVARVRLKFARIRGRLRAWVAANVSPVANVVANAAPDPQKLEAFENFLKTQFGDVPNLWDTYIQQAYRKGRGRAFDDVMQKRRALSLGDQRKMDAYAGTRADFLRSSFNQPASKQKIQQLIGKSYTDIDGMTDAMSDRMGQTLADGMLNGLAPKDVADNLVEELDITERSAQRIARTEIIRAHAEGQLDAMEDMGVEEVGVAVEWSTADDDSVCPLCDDMDGVVLTIVEARGLIPRHPNCRCCFTPANVGEDDEDQTRTKSGIMKAIRASYGDEGKPGAPIAKERPESILGNAVYDFSRAMAALNYNPNHDEQGRFTLYRGMSQEKYRRVRATGMLEPEPLNPHNDATTDIETAKLYADAKQNDDVEGVVVKFKAHHTHVKQDDVFKDDYKILHPIDMSEHEVVHGTAEGQ